MYAPLCPPLTSVASPLRPPDKGAEQLQRFVASRAKGKAATTVPMRDLVGELAPSSCRKHKTLAFIPVLDSLINHHSPNTIQLVTRNIFWPSQSGAGLLSAHLH